MNWKKARLYSLDNTISVIVSGGNCEYNKDWKFYSNKEYLKEVTLD